MNTKIPVLGYIASPYNHRADSTRHLRKHHVIDLTNTLIHKNFPVVSPIAHNVPIIEQCGSTVGWEYWQQFDTTLLYACDYLLVYQLEGWDVSVGVSGEIYFAKQHDIPIIYFNPKDELDSLFDKIKQINKRTRIYSSVNINEVLSIQYLGVDGVIETISTPNMTQQKTTSSMTAEQKTAYNIWDHFSDIHHTLVSASNGEWSWANNPGCKYIELRLDMRSGHCIISNQHSIRINPDELAYQLTNSGKFIPWVSKIKPPILMSSAQIHELAKKINESEQQSVDQISNIIATFISGENKNQE